MAHTRFHLSTCFHWCDVYLVLLLLLLVLPEIVILVVVIWPIIMSIVPLILVSIKKLTMLWYFFHNFGQICWYHWDSWAHHISCPAKVSTTQNTASEISGEYSGCMCVPILVLCTSCPSAFTSLFDTTKKMKCIPEITNITIYITVSQK